MISAENKPVTVTAMTEARNRGHGGHSDRAMSRLQERMLERQPQSPPAPTLAPQGPLRALLPSRDRYCEHFYNLS